MPTSQIDGIEFSSDFESDYASAPSEIQDAAAKEIERIAKAPDTFGYFYLGNWDSTRWVAVGSSHALLWQPYPLKILRLIPLPEGDEGGRRPE